MNILTETLLDWYADNKRDLPWRDTVDPYRIQISEIILQQTRIVQRYEYFLRFIRHLPDAETLATASEDEVLRYWQGLGHYSRARNSRAVTKSMDGKFPAGYQEIHALKGVSNYAAAAICSIAYNMPYAMMDENVYHVLSRYWGADTPIDSTGGKGLLVVLADEMLDKPRPAIYDQAITDFGAVQCTPQAPDCMFYPLANSCAALPRDLVMQLPVRRRRTKTFNRYFNYIYAYMGTCTSIHKRTTDDIWKNLFELLLIEADGASSEKEFLSSASFRLLLAEGERLEVRSVLRNVKHALLHRVIYANFYGVVLPENSRSSSGYQCIKVEDLE